MRVLLVNDSSSPSGGAEIMTLRIASFLRERGHEVKVFSSDLDTGGGPPQADYLCNSNNGRFYNLTTLHNASAAKMLQAAIEDFRPDLIHVRMFLTQLSPSILPSLARIPSIHHVVWYRSVCPTGLKMLPNGSRCTVHRGLVCVRSGCLNLYDWGFRMLQLERLAQQKKAFNLYLANSHSVAGELKQDGFSPIRVLWNAVPVRPQRTHIDDQRTVLYVGRLFQGKGVDVLLRAFRRVVDEGIRTRLHIAGSGPMQGELEALTKELDLTRDVQFHGQVPQAELESRFSGAWVQVVPSVWPEPFGIVAAEAMMRGVPVIATRSGGLAEFIEHERTGLHVEPGSVEDLTAALIRVLSHSSQSENMGRDARKFAIEHLSERPFTDTLLDVYHQTLQLASGSR